jgi:hypothetical protein
VSAQENREAAAAVEALHAISWCLRAVAQGWTLDPRERTAALALLARGMEGISAADLQAAVKLLRAPHRLGRRQRNRAAELSVRLAEQAETLLTVPSRNHRGRPE